MALKDKIMNWTFIKHPKLITYGIGFAVTFGIGLAIGIIEHNQAFAQIPKSPDIKPPD